LWIHRFIPRARKHLFANIVFHIAKILQSWKKTFPDPSSSPAHYNTDLFIDYYRVTTAAETEVNRWIKGFSPVEHLWLRSGHGLLTRGTTVSFIPFHGFSPPLESLGLNFVALPSPQVFDLILSFPLLGDLTLNAYWEALTDNGNGPDRLSTVDRYSRSPMFTGSMEHSGGQGRTYRHLAVIPTRWHPILEAHFNMVPRGRPFADNTSLITSVVSQSGIRVRTDNSTMCPVEPGSTSVGFSKAVKLTGVAFRVKSRSVEWITMGLQTITPEHRARQIPMYEYLDFAVTKVGADIG